MVLRCTDQQVLQNKEHSEQLGSECPWVMIEWTLVFNGSDYLRDIPIGLAWALDYYCLCTEPPSTEP